MAVDSSTTVSVAARPVDITQPTWMLLAPNAHQWRHSVALITLEFLRKPTETRVLWVLLRKGKLVSSDQHTAVTPSIPDKELPGTDFLFLPFLSQSNTN